MGLVLLSKRKKLMLIIGALLCTGLSCFAVLPFLTGDHDMQDYCQAQRPRGMTLYPHQDPTGTMVKTIVL
ncbi:MAG: hypothetical protein H6R21_1017 [Proteobacteria bacterium]|nr:hypothetical protein [Pseudomonadota bacterium]